MAESQQRHNIIRVNSVEGFCRFCLRHVNVVNVFSILAAINNVQYNCRKYYCDKRVASSATETITTNIEKKVYTITAGKLSVCGDTETGPSVLESNNLFYCLLLSLYDEIK